MTLADKVIVNAHYTRSVNLERDRNTPDVVRGYLPTPRALHTLARIAPTLRPEAAPRAWSLVGPYGAGKSSFAAFLTHLLGDPHCPTTGAAREVLATADPIVARAFPPLAKRHCVVVLTGSPEPFAPRVARALAEAAAAHWSGPAAPTGRPTALVASLQWLADSREVPVSTLLEHLHALQDALAADGAAGLLLIIDELGKFLEYEARHYGANDIYLLQALAERANAAHPVPLSLVVLLHQAMDQYARGLGDTMRNEWAKVQGRFETIPFVETAEQVLRVVATAFTHRLTPEESARIHADARAITEVLARAGALPVTLDTDSATTLFARCYPLHPLCALLLPLLCQKVAQNERTLFSYLGSREPHGFNDSLARLGTVGDWVLPWQVYEYFIRNQSAAIADHFTQRRWMEVVTATERLGDAPERELRLLKSIGLLNIIGAQGGLKASRDLVELCADPPGSGSTVARRLQGKAVLQYRRFSGEYRVWEGSDFDLNAAVAEQLERLGNFNLADALNRRQALPPVLARRHAIHGGTLRYFLPRFADAEHYHRLPRQAGDPRILFYLIHNAADHALLHDAVLAHFTGADIVVACPNAEHLRAVVGEVMALERVRAEAQALNTDPVAQREYKERLAVATAQERELLRALAEDPSAGTWYWRGEPLVLPNRRALQASLSEVLDQIYPKSPVICNELINRDRLSSQAAAARNRLLAAMLNESEKPDLGIDKFPPERAIYLALLRGPGIHRCIEGRWQFATPLTDGDAGHFRFGPVWQAIETFLHETERAPRAFTALDGILCGPPYGLKRGVLPILYLAAYLAHQDEIALYEDGLYIPFLREDQIERFVRRPGDFSVQSFRIEGLRASLFREYARMMLGDADRTATVIALARPLARFMSELPEYSLTTRRISETAQKVRDLFHLSKSPQALLFEQLPTACGVSLDGAEPDAAALALFTERMKQALRELKGAYPALLERFQKLLAVALNLRSIDDLDRLRALIRGRVEGLDRYTIDVDGLRAFIRRLAADGGSAEEWFNNVLLFLGKKPSRKWHDSDAEAAEHRLGTFARRLHDLEKLRVHYDGERQSRSGEFQVMLLRTLRQGGGEFDEAICVDRHTEAAIRSTRAEVAEMLDRLPDRSLKLALLAELAEEVLAAGRSGLHLVTEPAATDNEPLPLRLASGGPDD